MPSENVTRAWARLVKAQHKLLAAVEADLRRNGQPPLAWYDALLELRRVAPGGLRPVELERQMLLAQHNVSRLIARLEQDGSVTRAPCPDDGRGQIIVITDKGIARLRQMWPVYGAAIQHHFGSHLSDADAATLAALLGRLSA